MKLMSVEELEAKHKLHEKRKDEWDLYRLAYDGGERLIEYALKRHPRESNENWKMRLEEGMVFNYAQAIVDLFNFYLTEKPATRTIDKLKNDKQWEMFLKDADLHGTDFNIFTNNTQKLASVYGAVGILVNKYGHPDIQTVGEEIYRGVYPYCSVFTLPNIYDWAFQRNPDNGRPQLYYLKLLEDIDENIFLIWYLNSWERWQIKEDQKGNKYADMIEEGENPLGEIPFVWMENLRNLTQRLIGVSDIKEIARILVSIVRNLSCGEEVIKFAGFPMMRLPMEREDDMKNEIPVGNLATLEFNPEWGEKGKPDWLESPVEEPIEAILKWTDRKVDELYRVAHLSGVHAQRKSNNEVASGLALRYEFQQLNSVLGQKASNLEETEKAIMRFWLMWQNKIGIFSEVEISRPKNFSLDDLSLDLENANKALESVISETFQKKMQARIAKQTLPDLTEEDTAEIEQELEQANLLEQRAIVISNSSHSAVEKEPQNPPAGKG